MKRRIWRIVAALLLAAMVLGLLPVVFAVEEMEAENLTASTEFSGTGYSSFAFLKDENKSNYKTSTGNAEITLTNEKPFVGIYILFDLEYGEYTVTDNVTGKVMTVGKHEMLHEYIRLEQQTTSVTLKFSHGAVCLSEIYVFAEGDLPDFVQVWDAPAEGKTDVMLLATHGDDDQLFFAGVLPCYAAREECTVQVVYLTDHRNLTRGRVHEMINGLWSVGIRVYPVFGRFADFRIDSLEGTYQNYEKLGTSREELQSFVVEQLRRFKPQVAVGHDIKGEYGHGMHMVYTDLLIKALDMINDPAQFPESAGRFGTWEVKKTYLHLYGENKIQLDLDQPMEEFDGLSPFQVTQKYGYPCHISQQYTWFTDWLNWENKAVGGTKVTKATQITQYNPAQYGLYRTTVGEDVEKDDFLENIVTYAAQERLEQERLEQERLEQERLEQERLEQERLEQERLEQERLERERMEKQKREELRRDITVALILLAVLVVSLALVLLWARTKDKKCVSGKRKNNP